MIAIDLPGFGKSSPIPYPFALKDYAETVKKVLLARNIDRYFLLGHSFGGRISILLAATSPCVEGLILADAAGIKPRFSLKKFFAARRFRRKKSRMGEVERAKYGSSDYRSLSPVEKRSFSLVVRQDLTPYLPQITCPTLIVFGQNDQETPLYMARKLHKGIKRGELVVIKNAGHFAMVEKAQAFNRAVMAFFVDAGFVRNKE